MYDPLILLEERGKIARGKRIYVGGSESKNEAWLRDLLFDHPEIIPTFDIDPAFGKLIPLCKELRTEAGPIDAAFINEHGRLTIVECKLWKNPQARREVVAQALHYVSALSRWTYADLQRQVSAAVGNTGNLPLKLVQSALDRSINEKEFVDATSRSLREGRILVLIAGEGIREGVLSLTELVNRNATKAFSFGLVEVAIYEFESRRLAIQPRILAKTETITRHITLIGDGSAVPPAYEYKEIEETGKEAALSEGKRHLKDWWGPIVKMAFDDPEQDPPRWLGTNNISLTTPFPGIQIKAWAIVNGSQTGVYLTGTRAESLDSVIDFIKAEQTTLIELLPKGTIIDPSNDWPIVLKTLEAKTDDDRYTWLKQNLNAFVNALRPRLKRWYEEQF